MLPLHCGKGLCTAWYHAKYNPGWLAKYELREADEYFMKKVYRILRNLSGEFEI